MYCKVCNSNIPDDAAFCPNCGVPAEDSYDDTRVLGESDYQPYFNTDNTGVNVKEESNQQNFDSNNKNSESFSVDLNEPQPQYQNTWQQNYNNQSYQSENNFNQNTYNQSFDQNAYNPSQMNIPIENPNIINCYKKFWKNYTYFSGRSRRSEYWFVVLMNVIINVVLSILSIIPYIGVLFGALASLYSLAILIPSLALAVRRLHDIGKEWYNLFFILIPIAGPILLIVFYCQDSQAGTNKFGENPKGL